MFIAPPHRLHRRQLFVAVTTTNDSESDGARLLRDARKPHAGNCLRLLMRSRQPTAELGPDEGGANRVAHQAGVDVELGRNAREWPSGSATRRLIQHQPLA